MLPVSPLGLFLLEHVLRRGVPVALGAQVC